MRKIVIAATASLLFAVPLVYAQTKGTGSYKQPLVQAQCFTGTQPIACDLDVTFKNGFYRLKKLKQPKLVQNTVVGKIRMQAVTPPQTNLDAIVTGLRSYGSDPDSDCPLANTQVFENPLFTSDMTCQVAAGGLSSNCKGTLQRPPFGNTPPQCSDVTFIVENLDAEVYEDGSIGNPAGLIARNGIAVIGRSPDCNSGGAGCPLP